MTSREGHQGILRAAFSGSSRTHHASYLLGEEESLRALRVEHVPERQVHVVKVQLAEQVISLSQLKQALPVFYSRNVKVAAISIVYKLIAVQIYGVELVLACTELGRVGTHCGFLELSSI